MIGLGYSPFARRYLGNRCCFLLLGLLRCFSSPGIASYGYLIHHMIPCLNAWWVAPFGYPRISARLQLPEAYRRLPRPSSPPGTQASTVCPYYLDLTQHYAVVNEHILTLLVGLGGLEPPTSRLSGVRSDPLSYKPTPQTPAPSMVEMSGFEPLTPCLQGRCSPN